VTGKRKRKRKVRKSQKRPFRKALKLVALILLAAVTLSIMMVLPLRWFNPVTTAFMLQDDSGREPILHEWVSWTDVGTAMPLAAVAAEDQRFAVHFGVDWQSIRKSLDEAGDGGRLRGASTISQQLAKNLFLTPSRSFVRKGVEAYMSIVIETWLPKRRILEIYVNVVELGPGIYGVGAASRHYFNKAPRDLSDRQAALLAATLPNPIQLKVDTPSPYLRERQTWIVSQMQRLRHEDWLYHLR
jgi:monofunctional biosynthetic peptidoglycan transglycosylase